MVPEPSERWTTVIAVEGSLTPALIFARAGSFHFVILPRKMSARIGPVNLICESTPSMLYTGTTAPSTVGKWSTGPGAFASISSVIG